MPDVNVVLLQSDPEVAETLVSSLGSLFHSVREARSLGELRSSVAHHDAEIVILDMELAPFSEVQRLSQDFPGVRIICNHRLAEESMWTEALIAGAADCCCSHSTHSIVAAAMRNTPHAPMLAV